MYFIPRVAQQAVTMKFFYFYFLSICSYVMERPWSALVPVISYAIAAVNTNFFFLKLFGGENGKNLQSAKHGVLFENADSGDSFHIC